MRPPAGLPGEANREIFSSVANALRSIHDFAKTGRVLRGVQLVNASNPNPVLHNIGRNVSGWMVLRTRSATAGASCSESTSSVATSTMLYLDASADQTIDLLVW